MTVRIYIKPRCSLCEEACAALEEMQHRVSFTLERVDIRSREDTWTRYRHAVPVVEVDGQEVARLRIDTAALERRLRGTTVA